MRRELRGIGIAKEYVEVMASVGYLRNEIDVGHVSFHDLELGKVEEVFQFVELATGCLRLLLLRQILADDDVQQRLAKLRSTKARKIPRAIAFLHTHRELIVPENGSLKEVARLKSVSQ
jgi:hypothetical protein